MTRAFGLGELPGTTLIDAADVVIGETGDLPHIPQLPARGLGADAVGRTAALTEWISVDKGPRGWVLSPRKQLLIRAARDMVDRDLDACEAVWSPAPETIKVQVTGPWTMAAQVELANGHRVITDRGALNELTDAITHAAIEHAADVAKRFGADVIVQLDEPELAAVVAGRLRGTSDLDEIRAVHAHDAAERLHRITSAIEGEVLVNMTGYAPLWEVAVKSGADAVLTTVDTIRGEQQYDGFGESISGGLRVGLGVKFADDPRDTAVRLAKLFSELGLDKQLLTTDVDVHPAGGITRGTLVDAAAHYRHAAAVAGMLESDAGDL